MGIMVVNSLIDFPGGSVGKVSACNAGDPGSIPALGRSPGEGNGNPFFNPFYNAQKQPKQSNMLFGCTFICDKTTDTHTREINVAFRAVLWDGQGSNNNWSYSIFWILSWAVGKNIPVACHNQGLCLIQFCLPIRASLVAQTAKNLPAMQETQVRSLGWEDPLEKEMATHSS